MIRYSIETLWHFNCDHCGKWWSIGDHQNHDQGELTCPHCGTRSWLAPAEPLETAEPIQAKVEDDGPGEEDGPWAEGWEYRSGQKPWPTDPDGWIEWKGGECPVASGTMVEVRFSGGESSVDKAHCWYWGHDLGEGDIIAYRVVD